MWGVVLISILVGFATAQIGGEEARVVNIAQGPVRGYKQPGSEVFAFYGIPYATAPTGTQKFMPPLRPLEWTETLEAVRDDIICMQPFFPNAREDCLVAHVYVPDTEQTNLPVMVHVHGGAFQYSFGTVQKPIALVNDSNMIVVSFNYRVGAHGFLCLGTEEVPGNAGMKDQVALLRWVRDNIAYFGGNPNDVTIEGCSAGGVSVGLLALSSTTEGLFNRVIAGSGGTAGSFGVQIDPLANAKSYASILNFDNVDDLQALEEFYKTASYETLFSQHGIVNGRPDATVWFAPCVEKDLGQEMFLDEAPVSLMRRSDLTRYPMLYGFANMEGLIRIGQFEIWKDMMNEKFSDFLPADLQFDTDEEKEAVATRVKQFYFQDEDVSENNILSYIDYFSDVLFVYSMLRSVKIHSEFGVDPIYLYEYSYTDINTDLVPYTTERGANHCHQSAAFLDENKANATIAYIEMKGIMREFFTNFVSYGQPVPEGSSLPYWPPTNVHRNPHMAIGTTVQLQGLLHQDRAEFWDSIYDQYYRMPIAPNSAYKFMLKPFIVIVTLIYFI